MLFLTATVVSFYSGFFLGKAIAWKRGGVLEYTATISGALLFTVFTPWFGLRIVSEGYAEVTRGVVLQVYQILPPFPGHFYLPCSLPGSV